MPGIALRGGLAAASEAASSARSFLRSMRATGVVHTTSLGWVISLPKRAAMAGEAFAASFAPSTVSASAVSCTPSMRRAGTFGS